jgi:N-acetylmuramoyl-L-alanine amidase
MLVLQAKLPQSRSTGIGPGKLREAEFQHGPPETLSADSFVASGKEQMLGEGAALSLQGRRILIDPGHGGSDPGAGGPAGGRETDVNLGVSEKLRDKLESLGADVRMTRIDDTNVGKPGGKQIDELRARVAMANAWPAEVYVSVHSNSNRSPTPHGTETYHSRNASVTSKRLAEAVHQEMVEETGFQDRGVKAANFYVLKNTTMPAILVETGFISNPREERQMVDPQVQDNMASAISRGLQSVFEV